MFSIFAPNPFPFLHFLLFYSPNISITLLSTKELSYVASLLRNVSRPLSPLPWCLCGMAEFTGLFYIPTL